MTRTRHGRNSLRLLVAIGVAAALVLPDATDAQEPNPAETERQLNEVRAQSGEVALQVDALEAQDAQVQTAIATLETNVATQTAELDEAERALAAAEAEVATAEANVVTAQGRIDALNQQTDDLVVEAFVNPASDNALDGFRADTLSDMMVKQELVDISADADADVLDQLEQAHEDLAVEQANKEAAAEAAEEKRGEAESALEEVQNALAQQEAFAADVEERLNAKLAEAESLRTFDAELADQLVREQAEVAARLRAAQEAAARQAAAEAAAAAAAAAAAQPSGGGGGVAAAVVRRRWWWRRRRWWRWRWRWTRAVGDRPRPRRSGHRDLSLRRVDQGGRVDRRQRAGAARRGGRPGRLAVCQQRVAQPRQAGRAAAGPLRQLVLRDLPDAVLSL